MMYIIMIRDVIHPHNAFVKRYFIHPKKTKVGMLTGILKTHPWRGVRKLRMRR
jgi:hypothetical protein